MQKITKKIFTIVFVAFIFSVTSATVWAQLPFNIGDAAGTSAINGRSIARDASNNIYVIGELTGTADFDPSGATANLTSDGFIDVFVAKYDAAGVYQWAFKIGSYNGDVAGGIAADAAGDIYVTGGFQLSVDFKGMSAGPNVLSSNGGSDIFVAKYNSSGLYQWAIAAGNSSTDYSTGVALDGSGNVLVAGQFGGTVDFNSPGGKDTLKSAGSTDIFVAKYNSSGAYQWAIRMGGTSGDSPNAIAVDGTGNVLITGSFHGTADFDPSGATANLVSTKTILGIDGFVAKYNSSGAYLWAFALSNAGTAFNSGKDIVTDGNNNIYVTGSFSNTLDFKGTSAGPNNLTSNGGTDIFVAQYNSFGACQWAFNVGGGTGDVGASIDVDAGNNIYITGNFTGPADFDPGAGIANVNSNGSSADIFVAKYNSSGAYQCAFSVGGGNADAGYAVAIDGSGNVLVTGYFEFTADFDPGAGTKNITSKANDVGASDVFIAKYTGCALYTGGGCLANAGNNQSICQGVNNSATIGSATTSGHTYSWSPSTGLSSSTVSQPTATPSVTTTYTLTETVTATSCQSTATVVVFVGTQPPTPVVSPSGPTTFCTGGSVMLSVGGSYTNYSWSNGASTQSITVNTSASYSVTVNNSPGCFAASSATSVTVNPLPAANAGGNKVVCPGVGTTIGAGAINGDTYSWLPVTALSSNTVSQPTASPSVNTTYTLTETITATGCSATHSVIMVLNPTTTPVITAPSTSICPGGSVALNAGGGYSSYLWSTNATTQSINATAQGNYTVTVTNSTGCSASSAAVNITFKTAPAADAGPDTKNCSGTGTTIGTPSVSGNAYSWSPSTGLSSTNISQPVANPSVATTYTLTETIMANGCTAANTVVVTIGIAPPAPTITKKNDTLLCSITASGYQWYRNATLISGATDKAYVPTQGGDYTVSITVGGCSATSSSYTWTSINSVFVDKMQVSVYPVPASSYFIVESKTTALQAVTLYDVLGKRVLSASGGEVALGADDKRARINVEGLAAGVYFVQVRTGNASSILRIVKE